MEAPETTSGGESVAAASAFEWGGLLDFVIDDDDEDDTLLPPWAIGALDSPMPPPPPPLPRPPHAAPPPRPTTLAGEGSGLVRKRDPRLLCSNFSAGRIPCSCPMADEAAPPAEREGAASGERKRARKVRAAQVVTLRCQVPRCEAEIGELKGYHRRHRVCLQCACASSVVLDGGSKRYCQQCGKFHMLSDFDEGKRSCRRKLERHNKRRRRRHADDSITVVEEDKEPQGGPQANVSCLDESRTVMLNELAFQTDEKVVSNKLIERKVPAELDDGYDSSFSLFSGFTTTRGNSFLSFGASDETQNEERADNSKSPISCTLCNSKSSYSSTCPTGRISFKLYDWNPAEFPRQLRHQVFKWLASMPVELEGYIRPGCTILTIFIAMPNFMWEKLSQDVVSCIQDLIYAPKSMLVGRGNIHIYLCNNIVQILKGFWNISWGTSMRSFFVKYMVRVSNPANLKEWLTQMWSFINCHMWFLVSFAGKYLELSSCLAISHGEITSCKLNDMDPVCNLEHEMFRISIPQTDSDVFGPAFIEVENKLGISNFVPILFGNKLICSEFERIYRANNCCLDGIYKTTDIDATSHSCKSFISKQTSISALLMDIAWMLRSPGLEEREVLCSTNIQRLVKLLKFLLQMESFTLLEVVLHYLDGINWLSLKREANDMLDADWCLFLNYMNQARETLSLRTPCRMRLEPDSGKSSCSSDFSQSYGDNDMKNDMLCTNQVGTLKENHEAAPLTSQRDHNLKCLPQRWKKDLWWNTLTRKAPVHVAVVVAVTAIVCFAARLTLFHHPRKVVAVFLKRRLFNNQQP